MTPGRTLLVRGLQAARGRLGLVALLYSVGALLSLAFAGLLVKPLQEAVAASSYAPTLAESFDLALWADLLELRGGAVRSQLIHLAWIIPVSLLWKAAASVGILHALQGHSFWQGAARYGPRSLLLGMLFFCLSLLVVVVVVLLFALIGAQWEGEIGRTWVWIFFGPAAAAFGLAVVTVMRDAARAALVVGGRSTLDAAAAGISAAVRHRSIGIPFLVCLGAGSLFAALSLLAELVAPGALPAIVRFAAQQGMQVLTAAVIVGWYGCLVAYAEAIWPRSVPSSD